VWHLGIARERGVFLDWNSEGMGGLHSSEFHTHGGVSALNFQRGKMAKSLIEIADLITFLVCKSSTK